MKKKPPIRGLRWYVVAMLCLAAELNYFDRQALSVLAQTIQDELGMTTIQYANITSWFLISYTVMYAVSGRLLDLFGARKSFIFFVCGWSLATALHGVARSAAQLSLYRFLLGATEAAIIPGGVKAVSEWFPLRERILATGLFNGGTAVGGALAAPVVAWIALSWGWRWAFVLGGALGFVWVAVWVFLYWRPREHSRISEEELELIESDAGEPAPEKTIPLRHLFGMKAAWGCMFVRMLTDPFSYFFIFWIPKYLQQERGFDLADVGKYSWIPFVAIAIGNICGGLAPGWMMNRTGWSYNRSRKTVMFAAACIIPACCISITQVPGAATALTLLSVAMFFHASFLTVGIPAEIFPPHVVGTISGISGCLGGLAGAISQQAVGWTVQNLSFTPIFLVSSVVHISSFAIICLLIGKLGTLKSVNVPETSVSTHPSS